MTREPDARDSDRREAQRLSWWTLGSVLTVVAVMGFTAGSSQAMRTALLEDVLSLVPAAVFLLALHFEERPPNARFPYGFLRVNSVAFLVSAVALAGMGAFLLFESVHTLVKQEHVTIMPVRIGDTTIWMGWLMLAALLYSAIVPMLLARRKLPLAERLQDKVLHTDAMMQKADWMTGLAGAAGVLGVGLGFWWADATAAGVISLSILRDGVNALRTASAELIDGAPRSLGDPTIADDAARLHERLRARYPGGEIMIRETGRFIRAEVCDVSPPPLIDLDDLWPGPPDRRWRLASVTFGPPPGAPDRRAPDQGRRVADQPVPDMRSPSTRPE